jgi:hypothetical protein
MTTMVKEGSRITGEAHTQYVRDIPVIWDFIRFPRLDEILQLSERQNRGRVLPRRVYGWI